MEMSSLLMRRAAWVTLLGLCCALLAALWQAQVNVRHERIGALRTAELVAHLTALQGAGRPALAQAWTPCGASTSRGNCATCNCC